jgi:hypothetical protein
MAVLSDEEFDRLDWASYLMSSDYQQWLAVNDEM